MQRWPWLSTGRRRASLMLGLAMVSNAPKRYDSGERWLYVCDNRYSGHHRRHVARGTVDVERGPARECFLATRAVQFDHLRRMNQSGRLLPSWHLNHLDQLPSMSSIGRKLRRNARRQRCSRRRCDTGRRFPGRGERPGSSAFPWDDGPVTSRPGLRRGEASAEDREPHAKRPAVAAAAGGNALARLDHSPTQSQRKWGAPPAARARR